jgi:hypothetical protein
MKNLDAWIRKEIKAMDKMDAKIDKQLDKLEAIVGIKKSKKVTKAKKVVIVTDTNTSKQVVVSDGQVIGRQG